jgi:serine/threonine protein kinase
VSVSGTPEADLIPVKIGIYETVRELGRGASGTVYLVVDPDGVHGALKLLPTGLRDSPSRLARFRTEIEALRNLNHPSIVKIHEVGEETGRHFYVMEYLSGGSLADKIKEHGALSLVEALEIATSICSALEHAHAGGIIHRDIKPANVIFDENGRARVVDFGIAKLTDVKGVTTTRQVIGTVEYMSPEQAAAKEVDHRTDVYSLGIVLYEMVTGRVPFRSDSPPAVLRSHQYSIPEAPREWNSSVPEWLNKLVLDMIEKGPEQRPQSAAEVIQRIEARRAQLKVALCSVCDAELEDGQAVCIQCGTNVSTGDRAGSAADRAPRAARRAAIVAVALGIVAAGAVWSLQSARLSRKSEIPYEQWQAEHFSLGERFYRLGDFRNAEREFRRTIELGPDTQTAAAAAEYLERMSDDRSDLTGEQAVPDEQ